jgi:hypothetical protein
MQAHNEPSTSEIARVPVIALAVLFLTWTGCATTPEHVRWYDGPPVSTNDIALLKLQHGEQGGYAFVETIDGVDIGRGKSHSGNRTREIELMPAPHTLEVAYVDTGGGRSIANAVVNFVCESNHVYDLHVARVNDGFGPSLKRALVGGHFQWKVWIIDERTAEPVFGTPRAEPPRWYE